MAAAGWRSLDGNGASPPGAGGYIETDDRRNAAPCAETATLPRARIDAGIRAALAREDRQECRQDIAARFDRLDRLAWATLAAVASTVIGAVLLLHGAA